MNRLLVVVFLCVNVVALCRSEKCSETGAVKKSKTTEFQCINGQWTPVACLTDSKRIQDAKVVTTDRYMLQCQKVSPDEMRMVAVACVKNGHPVMPTQTVTVGHAYYTCRPTVGSVVLELTGCLGPNGKKLPVGATLDVDQFVFQCQVQEGVASLQPYGCIYRGQTVSLNDTVTEPDYWRVCRLDDNAGILLDVGGCVDLGMRLQPDEVFHNQGIIYKCVKVNSTVRVESIGCLEVTPSLHYIEHMIGEKWFEGQSQVKYEMECSKDITGVFKWAKRCMFMDEDSKGDGLPVEPMCMKKVGQRLYQCVRTENQLLRSAIVENFTDAAMKQAQKDGLELCN